jgi:hypothetical protein
VHHSSNRLGQAREGPGLFSWYRPHCRDSDSGPRQIKHALAGDPELGMRRHKSASFEKRVGGNWRPSPSSPSNAWWNGVPGRWPLSSPCRRRRWPEGQALQGLGVPGHNRHRRIDRLSLKAVRSPPASRRVPRHPFEIRRLGDRPPALSALKFSEALVAFVAVRGLRSAPRQIGGHLRSGLTNGGEPPRSRLSRDKGVARRTRDLWLF